MNANTTTEDVAVVTGGHPRGRRPRVIMRSRRGGRPDLRAKLKKMRACAEPFLHDNGAAQAYWDNEWEPAVVHATAMIESNRKEFYGLRLAAIVSAITVPSLVGLNLSGTGGTAVRWLTFALSLFAALSTAIIALFKFADRWIMYRALNSSLLGAGWALISSSSGDPQAWPRFKSATEAAKAAYDATYQKAVIVAAEASTDPR